MSDKKGSNINKSVKGRESPFLSFLEFSIFLLFLEREGNKNLFFYYFNQ